MKPKPEISMMFGAGAGKQLLDIKQDYLRENNLRHRLGYEHVYEK